MELEKRLSALDKIYRCLVSRNNCGDKGYAEIDDFVLSVNTVFLQTIEHLDIHGCADNLTDVLDFMLAEDNWAEYDTATLGCTKTGLISNHPLTVLMIPPSIADGLSRSSNHCGK